MPTLKALFDPRPRVSAPVYRRDVLRAALAAAVLICLAVWLGGQGWRSAAIGAVAPIVPAALVVLSRTAGRLRDRDRTPWLLAVYGILYVVSLAPIEDLADTYPVETLASALAILAFFVWFFVETWLRAGTPGPNRFGPPPVETPVASM
ncbi:DUF805 domain-containing protein [uncultured Methylobacterium sp.]|uniref:DUF805 domain-containing protein n=1 Tax=uncultured Methylobacterium sp. TaxID=157278 RepID=UPI0035CB4FE3